MQFSAMNIDAEILYVQVGSIKCSLPDPIGVAHTKPFSELLKTVTEDAAYTLLMLHPILVRKVQYSEGEQLGQRYEMTAGVNSYYLARSVLAGRDIPVLHIQTDTDIPFHMVEQLLTYALVDVASKDRVLRMEGWITTHEQHLESLVDGLSTRKKQAALMGLTDSRVRAIRDDTNKKKKMPTAQMQLI